MEDRNLDLTIKTTYQKDGESSPHWKLALRSPSGREYSTRLHPRYRQAVMQLLEGQLSDQLCSTGENLTTTVARLE